MTGTVALTAETDAETKRKKFGEDIAFGMQQTLTCWATDFIDPYIGEKIQDRFQDATHKRPTGSTWIGEFVGDTGAFFAFLGVQRFIPSVTNGLKKATRAMFNRSLEKSAKGHLRHWAREHNVAEGSPEYKAKMEEWKEFQADNIAKSSVITASSVGLNVLTQKALSNTHKLSVIFLAKVAGAAITMASMLGLRFAVPKSTQQLDKELSERYFTPLIRKTQKILDVEPEKERHHKHHHREKKSHARREEARRDIMTEANPEGVVR
jgi:hypothetical protein